jgi:hypothetical protein
MLLALSLIGAPMAAADADDMTVPLWRQDTTHLAADRTRIRTCLERQGFENACYHIIQVACAAEPEPQGTTPFALKRCDWRAIAAWEDEMDATLAQLRSGLSEEAAAMLDASQAQWRESVLADVTLAIRIFYGGNISGPVAANARAQSTAARTVFLHDCIRQRASQ